MWAVQIAGILIILIAFTDVFLTVLYARSGTGLLAPYFNRVTWRMFRGLGRLFYHRRDSLLCYSGPTLLVTLTGAWAFLYVLGFALIIWPELGSAIKAGSGPTPTDFSTALYYSGYSFTTLGTGDLVPQTALYRLLMVLKAALGFSFFTLIITYILSIYEALRQRNGFALTLHHKTDRTADPKAFVSRMASGGSLSEVTSEISSLNSRVSNLIEMHEFYPILHYFRFEKTYYALPRVIMILLDTASLLKTAPDADRHRAVVESLAVAELWASATHLMERMAASFLPKGYDLENPDISEQMYDAWSDHYRDLVRRLSEEGIDTADPPETGEQAYLSLRRRWHPYVEAFTTSMLFDTEEVIPTL